ncbi:hypothetical protein COCMIDRAFT_101129 [Bipolaris oryzae ATCC 44560]|uniref:Uncharacterized protein n=1 Tax=Bipolaris oryzae ATCC 44560 TaxID=930090 RepID=W6Z0B5_COCMI|nr:uncharacterized protein COCMIDRAFT_101129 [Bipolaris oryzae ATCC 44560]EUC43340.1 hypothetical protein COCMIDRAFT_101129 [Bipolaris oryzae ATCC 44560]
MAKSIHVVSKLDNTKHAVFHIDQDPPSLAASSVRVQTWLVSLTSNNLTYARSGTPLRWWDTYPVPEASPTPFNNREEWGIVPAWGYGRVLESTIDAIAPGSLLWGMWPTSEHAVDLQLEAIEPSGHWSERSTQRSKLMTIYNTYEQVSESNAQTMRMTALCKPLWQGPHLLNTSVFSARRIHPFGFGAPWSQEDADLSSAVVVSLSASSKTGRGFGWEMSRNRDVSKHGPRALIQMTSIPNTLPRYDSPLPMKASPYDGTDAMAWAEQFKPSRVVIVDFGASDAILESVRATASKLAPNITVVAVGYEAKVYTKEEIAARMATANTKVLVNTSGLRDRVIESQGALEFSRELEGTWDRCLKEEAFASLQVKALNAVSGEDGIEGAWSALCDRKVPADVGMVVEFSIS